MDVGCVVRARELLEEMRACDGDFDPDSARPALPESIDFASDDYLGLAFEPQVVAALRHASRVGLGGSRLIGRRSAEYGLLEEELAQWLGRERALVFASTSSAATAAIGVLSQIAQGAGRLVVRESIDSATGDAADIAAIVAELSPDIALLVDETHALGVLGPEGAGAARAFPDARIVILGSLSAALGAQGGFVAGPAAVIELIARKARVAAFQETIVPSVALAARIALLLARRADDRRARLLENAARLRLGLRTLSLWDGAADEASPIVAVRAGATQRAQELWSGLLDRAILATPIVPPAVAQGHALVRFSVRAALAPEHIDVLVAALRRQLSAP